MTAPDGDRLPATNSGQETCGRCGEHVAEVAGLLVHIDEEGLVNPAMHDTVPQQPPAQERERRCGCGATGSCSCRDDWGPARTVTSCACGGPCEHDGSLALALAEQQRLHELDPQVFAAPPSEADSAAEDTTTAILREALTRFADEHCPCTNALEHDRLARMVMPYVRAALAVSPGVQGGDGEARERLDVDAPGAPQRFEDTGGLVRAVIVSRMARGVLTVDEVMETIEAAWYEGHAAGSGS